MKPFLATTACFILATVVCARISDDELLPNDDVASVVVMESRIQDSAISRPQPFAYGAIGAAAFALIIAARRAGSYIQA